MVTEKQRANLAKGRAKGVRRGIRNRATNNNTHAAIFSAIGELPLTEQERALLNMHGATPEFLLEHKITANKKFVADLMRLLESYSNSGMANVIMQREEPQDTKIVFGKMTDEQLREFIAQRIGGSSGGD